MRRTFLSFVLVLILSAAAGCSFGNGFTAEKVATLTAQPAKTTPVRVIGANGSVTVTAEDRADILVTASLVATGPTQQEADDRLARTKVGITEADDALTIRTDFPATSMSWGKSDSVSYKILIPLDRAGADVIITTSNGAISVTGMSGLVDAATSNGKMTIVDHGGEAKLDTSNGAIVVRNLAGPLRADTSNGSIKVDLDPANPGPITLDTSNGRVTVVVGPAFSGSLALDTSNGSITVADPAGTARRIEIDDDEGSVSFNAEGPDSRIDTSNGSIRVEISG